MNILDQRFTPQTWPDNPERYTLEGKNKFIGFWLFLGGETVLFASLFATFLALKDQEMARQLFDLKLVFLMTIILLTSSLTSVYAIYHMKNYQFKKMQAWFFITVLLGLSFLGLEIYEFYHYVTEYQFGFKTSAFSSAYYTLV